MTIEFPNYYGKGYCCIKVANIVSVDGFLNYTKILTNKETYIVDMSYKEVKAKLKKFGVEKNDTNN